MSWTSEALNSLMDLRKGAQLRYEQAIVHRHEYQNGDGAEDTQVDAEFFAALVRHQASCGKILRRFDSLIDEISSQEARQLKEVQPDV